MFSKQRLRDRLPMKKRILLSPKSAKLKAQTEAVNRKATIRKAALELKDIRTRNGGMTKYGDISSIVKKYQLLGDLSLIILSRKKRTIRRVLIL